MPRGRKKRTREDPVTGEGNISDKQQDSPTSVAASGEPTPVQQSSKDRVAKTKQQKRKKKSRRVIDDTQSSQTLDDDKSPQVNPSVSATIDLPSENIDAVDKATDITTKSPSSKQAEHAITSTLTTAEVQVAASAPETPTTAEVQVAASATEIIAPTVQGLKSTQSKKGRKTTKNSPVMKNVQAPTNVRTTNTEPSDSPTTSIEEKDKTPLISQVLEDDIIGDEMIKTNSAASSSTVQPPPISERHFDQYRYNPPFSFFERFTKAQVWNTDKSSVRPIEIFSVTGEQRKKPVEDNFDWLQPSTRPADRKAVMEAYESNFAFCEGRGISKIQYSLFIIQVQRS